MNEYEVRITKSAENDLRDIVRYASVQLIAPMTAHNILRTIRESIVTLKTAPLIHPLVRDDRLASMGYQPLFIKNYIAFYTVNERGKIVFIERILHGRRDWMSIL